MVTTKASSIKEGISSNQRPSPQRLGQAPSLEEGAISDQLEQQGSISVRYW